MHIASNMSHTVVVYTAATLFVVVFTAATLTFNPQFGNEGGNVTACVSIVPPPEVDVDVIVATEDLDAVGKINVHIGETNSIIYTSNAGGADYDPVDNVTLTFGPGYPSEQCVVVELFLDSTLEFTEVFLVTATINDTFIQNSPDIGIIGNSDSKLLTYW